MRRRLPECHLSFFRLGRARWDPSKTLHFKGDLIFKTPSKLKPRSNFKSLHKPAPLNRIKLLYSRLLPAIRIHLGPGGDHLAGCQRLGQGSLGLRDYHEELGRSQDVCSGIQADSEWDWILDGLWRKPTPSSVGIACFSYLVTDKRCC